MQISCLPEFHQKAAKVKKKNGQKENQGCARGLFRYI